MNFDFDTLIDRTNTNSWKWEKYPKEVLPFWIADMDFESPIEIKNALLNSINNGVYGYTQTNPELIEVLVDRLKSSHDWEIKPEWIVVLPGMVPGLYISANMFPEKETGIMTSIPVYRPFIETTLQANKVSKLIPFKRIDNRCEMDFDLMESQVSESDKRIMLCNPHNQKRRVYTTKRCSKYSERSWSA